MCEVFPRMECRRLRLESGSGDFFPDSVRNMSISMVVVGVEAVFQHPVKAR